MEENTTQDEIRSRFEEARLRIKAEAEEKLRALDMSEAIINGTYSGEKLLSSGSQALKQGNSDTSRRLKITPEVKKAISEAGNSFSQQDISEIIAKKYPNVNIHRGSVSNAIARMLSRGELIDGYRIELAEEGGGSSPNVYRKVRHIDSQREVSDDDSPESTPQVREDSAQQDDTNVDFNEQDFDDIPF